MKTRAIIGAVGVLVKNARGMSPYDAKVKGT